MAKLPVAAQNLIVHWALNHFEDEMRRRKGKLISAIPAEAEEIQTIQDFIEAIELTAERFASSVRTNGMDEASQDTLEKFSRTV